MAVTPDGGVVISDTPSSSAAQQDAVPLRAVRVHGVMRATVLVAGCSRQPAEENRSGSEEPRTLGGGGTGTGVLPAALIAHGGGRASGVAVQPVQELGCREHRELARKIGQVAIA